MSVGKPSLKLLAAAGLGLTVPFVATGPTATACPMHSRHAAGATRASAAAIADMPAEGSFFYLGRSQAFAP